VYVLELADKGRRYGTGYWRKVAVKANMSQWSEVCNIEGWKVV
jgi:hypothetical protein